MDAALGREICLREGYSALLTGQIIPSGSDYQLSVQVVIPASGWPLITATERIRSPADLYAGVDQLARQLRRQLGSPWIKSGPAPSPWRESPRHRSRPCNATRGPWICMPHVISKDP